MLLAARQPRDESLGVERQVAVQCVLDLRFGYRDALETDVGVRRKFAQSLFDLFTGIDARWIEVAEVIDVCRLASDPFLLG